MSKKKETITIIDNSTGKKFEFNKKDGSIGPSVIDFSSFYSKTGMFVYDPGFTSTASCQSEITYIDGEKGQLLHRGYKIEELADSSDYAEVCYLLLNVRFIILLLFIASLYGCFDVYIYIYIY